MRVVVVVVVVVVVALICTGDMQESDHNYAMLCEGDTV